MVASSLRGTGLVPAHLRRQVAISGVLGIGQRDVPTKDQRVQIAGPTCCLSFGDEQPVTALREGDALLFGPEGRAVGGVPGGCEDAVGTLQDGLRESVFAASGLGFREVGALAGTVD